MNVKAWFVHELAHTLQHQLGVNVPARRVMNSDYAYLLVPGKAFASYGVEQQAEIVMHYYLLKNGVVLPGRDIKQYEQFLPFNPVEKK